MRPRPTADEATASVEAVEHVHGQRDLDFRVWAYRHADPAGICVVKDGLHFTRSGAENCARNSFQIAWKREKAAAPR